MSECKHNTGACSGRREFLVRTLSAAGGAMVGLSIAAQAADPAPATPPVTPPPGATAQANGALAAPGPAVTNDVVLELSTHPKLAKVGGWEVIQTPVGNILVMRTGPDTFAATAAVCTHRKGPLFYDAESGKIICETHGALFNSNGKVEKGPAKVDLKSYISAPAAVLHLGDK